jgi:hypothetical protein
MDQLLAGSAFEAKETSAIRSTYPLTLPGPWQLQSAGLPRRQHETLNSTVDPTGWGVLIIDEAEELDMGTQYLAVPVLPSLTLGLLHLLAKARVLGFDPFPLDDGMLLTDQEGHFSLKSCGSCREPGTRNTHSAGYQAHRDYVAHGGRIPHRTDSRRCRLR